VRTSWITEYSPSDWGNFGELTRPGGAVGSRRRSKSAPGWMLAGETAATRITRIPTLSGRPQFPDEKKVRQTLAHSLFPSYLDNRLSKDPRSRRRTNGGMHHEFYSPPCADSLSTLGERCPTDFAGIGRRVEKCPRRPFDRRASRIPSGTR
jgi:hypothetical protein